MTVEQKATALLSEHRVQVVMATERAVSARVRGSRVYDVTWDGQEPRWHCTCPNMRRCSHIEAVASVTMRSVGR